VTDDAQGEVSFIFHFEYGSTSRFMLHDPMADNHKHRARIFLHRGDLVQARAAWEAAVTDDRTADNQQALSDSLGNLGNTCALMNEFARAEQCYREVLQIQRTERNLTAVAHTLVNL
jgi:tetratricopeptide (TPR) repeat protein